MTTDLTMAQRLFGSSSTASSASSATSYGSTSSVRYGTVVDVDDAPTIEVELADTGSSVWVETSEDLAVGDTVKLVLNGTTYLVYSWDATTRSISSSAAETLAAAEAAIAEAEAAIEKDVAAIQETVQANIDEVAEELEKLSETIEGIDSTVTKNAAEVAEEVDALNAAVDALEAALAALDNTLDDDGSLTDEAAAAVEEAIAASTTVLSLASDIDDISDLIRATDDGLEVARIVDGEYTTTHTLMNGAGFTVYQQDGTTPITAMGEGFLVYDENGDLAGSFTESGVSLYAGLDDDDEPLQTAAFTDSGVSLYQDGVLRTGITTGYVRLYDHNGDGVFNVTEAGGYLGHTDGAHLRVGVAPLLTSGGSETVGVALYDEDANRALACTTEGVSLYDTNEDGDTLTTATFTDSAVSFFAEEDGKSVATAQYMSDSFTIGEEDNAHLEGTAAGVNIYGADNALVAAFTSDGVELYDLGTPTAAFTDSAVSFFAEDGETATAQYMSDSVIVGPEDDAHMKVASEGLTLYSHTDADETEGIEESVWPNAAFTVDGVEFYNSSGHRRAAITAAGMNIYAGEKSVSVAFFGRSSGRVGEDDAGANHTVFTDEGVGIHVPEAFTSTSGTEDEDEDEDEWAEAVYPFYITLSEAENFDVEPSNTAFRVSSKGNVGMGTDADSGLYLNGGLYFQNGTAGTSSAYSRHALVLVENTATLSVTEGTSSYKVDVDVPVGATMIALARCYFSSYTKVRVTGWNLRYGEDDEAFMLYVDSDTEGDAALNYTVVCAATGLI